MPRGRKLMFVSLLILVLLFSLLEARDFITPVTIRAGNSPRRGNMPDSSAYVINTGSTLSISRNWTTGKDREAWLKGEAYFIVHAMPDSNRFVLHSTHFDVVVQAAAFNLNNAAGETVWLKEGRAQVILHIDKPSAITLSPGDMIQYNAGQLVKSRSDGVRINAWLTR